MRPTGRENTGKWSAIITAAVMTALLLFLLIFFYLRYEKARTLHAALQDLQDPPVYFSRESGFFEKGFVLKLGRNPDLPENVEIRYTLNGDDPTADSLLYKDGIDLTEAVREMKTLAKEKEEKKAEVIRQAEEEAEAARLAAEAAAAAATAQAVAPESAGTAQITTSETTSGAALETAAAPAADTADKAEEKEVSAAAGETAAPTLEEGRESWQKELWTAASDAGIRPVRTDDGIVVLPVRACLIQGEDKSPVVTRTYVIGENVMDRYGDVYVASVVTDSYNLFDYDKGIMVPGSHYEKDVADGVRPDRAGNFYQRGDEWVKDGHVTLFAPDGQVLLEEDAGLAVAGYSSRIMPTRTFRIEASKARGTSDDYFHLDIFSDKKDQPRTEPGDATPSSAGTTAAALRFADTAAADQPATALQFSAYDQRSADTAAAYTNPALGAAADTFDTFTKIKFRSHGIPGFHIRSVRNQYAKVLTDECGFPGLTENRLGVMFLNGEFYTICDITPSTPNDYVARTFGLNVPDAIEKYSGSDVDVYTRTKIIKLLTADLKDPANQRALEAAVDMDNYLFYFALEVLFNNADWPYNNVTVWRYLGEQDPANPYSDGRIRFLIEDMDQILTNGLHGDPARWSSELIDYLMKDKGNTFHHVMECTRYRDTFLTYVDDLLRTAFEPEHACAVLDSLYAEMKREYILDYGQPFWDEMEQTAQTTAQNIREKEALYRANISKYMGLTDRYTVRIEAGSHASVTWNNMLVASGRTWTSQYYRGTSFTVTAHPDDGYTISGWEVNGRPVQTDTPALTISDDLLRDYPGTELTIRPMTE